MFGLKTTFGRIPMPGVRPLAPSLDTVGLLARDVEMLAHGMHLLDPGFRQDPDWRSGRIGRLFLPAAPVVDQAIDSALRLSELRVVPVNLSGWGEATRAGLVRLEAEAWKVNGHLIPTGKVGGDVVARLEAGRRATPNDLSAVDLVAEEWQAELSRMWERVDAIALPTLLDLPPSVEGADGIAKARATVPVNLAGIPALSISVPTHPLPASLQLVGPPRSEARLLEFGRRIGAAVCK